MRPVSFDYQDRPQQLGGAAHSAVVAHQSDLRAGGRQTDPRLAQSAEWCLQAVDQCWTQKSPQIRLEERGEAQRAYDVAREAYRQRLNESTPAN